MPSASDILPGVVLPAGIAFLVLLLAWQPWRRDGKTRGQWAGALAIAGGFAPAVPVIAGGVPPFPPVDSTDWLIWFMPAVILFGFADGCWKLPAAARWTLGSAIVAAMFILLLLPLIRQEARATDAWSGVAVFSLAAMAWWAAIEPLSRRVRGGAVPLALGLTTIGVAMILGFSGSQKYGQFGGALAGTVGAATVLAFLARGATLARGGIFAISLITFALLAIGLFYAEVTLLNIVLLAVAPLMAWGVELPVLSRLRGWKRLIMLAAMVLIPILLAVIPTGLTFQREIDSLYGELGY